ARVRALAEERGLEMACYGSYARAGAAEWTPERFGRVLDIAAGLGAPRVRVWAGTTGSAAATAADWQAVIEALRRWGALAADRGITLVVERHGNTLTDYGDTARRLIDRVNLPAVRLNYQVPYPPPAGGYADLAADLRRHLPVSAHIHVQNYRAEALTRAPLAEGIIRYDDWPPLLAEAAFDGWAMLEFLPEGSDLPPVELAQAEMASLRALLNVR
ncbi:MAG TPA: TIM barrel protein, partial [Armatimonadota bacterium]|nr:TIM barrel protein [Armatimonadota bacterium]